MGFYSKSRNSKNSNKNQKLYTIGHLSARIDAILKKIILTLQAASARTHFRGGVMGSNADLIENCLEPKESAYPSNSSKLKKRHETFITHNSNQISRKRDSEDIFSSRVDW